MDRKKVIDGLIASEVYNESERNTLEGLTDRKLQALSDFYEDEEREEDPVPEHEAGEKKKKQVVPTSEGMKSGMPFAANVEEYINQAPPDFREVLVNGYNAHLAEKATAVQTITANKKNAFTADELDGMSLNQLKKLADLAAVPQQTQQTKQQQLIAPRFMGQTGAPITDNTAAEQEPLMPPTMNFAEYRASQKAG